MSLFEVKRETGALYADFNQSGMELTLIYDGAIALEHCVDLFPYGFHESLKKAITDRVTTFPRISTGFGKKLKFTLEYSHDTINGDRFFKLKCLDPFFCITLREQEIKNLMAEMRSHMTRP